MILKRHVLNVGEACLAIVELVDCLTKQDTDGQIPASRHAEQEVSIGSSASREETQETPSCQSSYQA